MRIGRNGNPGKVAPIGQLRPDCRQAPAYTPSTGLLASENRSRVTLKKGSREARCDECWLPRLSPEHKSKGQPDRPCGVTSLDRPFNRQTLPEIHSFPSAPFFALPGSPSFGWLTTPLPQDDSTGRSTGAAGRNCDARTGRPVGADRPAPARLPLRARGRSARIAHGCTARRIRC